MKTDKKIYGKPEILERHADSEPLYEIDGMKILGKDVDEKNRTVYIVEMNGEKRVLLYNQLEQTKIPRDMAQPSIIKRFFRNGIMKEVRNFDDDGNHVEVDFQAEREKFLNENPQKVTKE